MKNLRRPNAALAPLALHSYRFAVWGDEDDVESTVTRVSSHVRLVPEVTIDLSYEHLELARVKFPKFLKPGWPVHRRGLSSPNPIGEVVLPHPLLRQGLQLLQHRPGCPLLLVRRIPVLPQDPLDLDPQPGPDVLAVLPIDRHAVPDRPDDLLGDLCRYSGSVPSLRISRYRL